MSSPQSTSASPAGGLISPAGGLGPPAGGLGPPAGGLGSPAGGLGPPAGGPGPPAPPPRGEFSILLGLSAPVVVAQVGMMAMSVIDLMMIARVGVPEVAAVAIASTLAWAWGSLGQGIVHGMDPIVSQAHGAGDRDGMALALQRGLVVATFVSIPIGVIWILSGEALVYLGQDPEVAKLAQTYMRARLPGVLGINLYIALRQYLAGRTLTRPAMWIMFISNALNIFLNWIFIFGHLGAPPLGLFGAGIATGITSILTPFLLAGWIRYFQLHEGAWRPWDAKCIDFAGLRRYVALGFPIGVQMWLEANAFSVALLMVGALGVLELAAFQLVLNVASMTFMVPLGVSIGAATRVGNLIGAADSDRIPRACRTALLMGASFMAGAGVAMIVLRDWLPRIYLEDPAVVALAATLMPIGGLFQIADGVQVVGGGLMRGMGRPRAAAVANLVGYYVLGLPLAWFLAFRLELGGAGVLLGMAAALGLVATLLSFWAMRTARRPISELRVALR